MTTVVAVASPLAVEACRRMDHVTSPDSPQRIVFIDVDGTILEHGTDHRPSPSRDRAARRNGHLVYLCTGRSAGDINPSVRAIGFDGAITNGGAFAVRRATTEERLAAHLMPRPRRPDDRVLREARHPLLPADRRGRLRHRAVSRTSRRTSSVSVASGMPRTCAPGSRRGRPAPVNPTGRSTRSTSIRRQGDLPQHVERHSTAPKTRSST
jgi:hypothetical protein